jgi:uncharacterized membrane protein
MPDIRQKLDLGSRLVIVVTLALFVAALFVKGFGHGLLLEAGVFLVSVKLIIMAARHGATDRELRQRLDQIDATLAEVRDRLGSGLRSEPTEAPQPR